MNDSPRLSGAFVEKVCRPLSRWLAAQETHRPLIVAFSGPPGSGKSTLVRALRALIEQEHGLSSAAFSLDDVYHTKAERLALAREVHPLLAVRGVPGTHDLTLANALLDDLPLAGPAREVWVPRFDKLRDDRAHPSEFERVARRPDLVLVDAWFWGASAPTVASLGEPCNDRERLEDPDGRFRRYVREALAGAYQALFARAHRHVRLTAPSWETTIDWRIEQQLALRGLSGTTPDEATRREITHFLKLFERVARLPPAREPEVTFELDAGHELARAVWARARVGESE